MTAKDKEFQPGAILHGVIVGCFRSAGTSFEAWCRENKVHRSTATNATYGQSGGDTGRKLLDKIINDAGRDLVTAAYGKRIHTEAARLNEVGS